MPAAYARAKITGVARGTEQQYRTWLELLGELLQQPLDVPWRCDGQVLPLLNQSFNGACSTRNCVSTEWVDYMVSSWPRDYLPKAPPVNLTVDARQQPLLRWYAVTGQPEPQSQNLSPWGVFLTPWPAAG